MKGKKRIVVMTLMAIMLITSMSIVSGCVNHLEDEVIIGDFVCQVMSDKTVNLKNLSEEGKKKKNVVVPQEINGMKVNMLGYRNAVFSSGSGCWESENLNKIYIEGKNYTVKRMIFNGCPNLNKIIFIDKDNNETSDFSVVNSTLFVNKSKYFSFDIQYNESKIPSSYAANVSYFYNYEDSLNDGYYWIDDIEDGELIDYIPEDPKREGYKFEGWYKEEECKNKWNFAEDRVIKAQIHLEGVERFIENKLFAKWAKE